MSKKTSGPWTVEHHLPGGRYGAIVIKTPLGTSVLKMWADDAHHLRLAHRIVRLLNAQLKDKAEVGG